MCAVWRCPVEGESCSSGLSLGFETKNWRMLEKLFASKEKMNILKILYIDRMRRTIEKMYFPFQQASSTLNAENVSFTISDGGCDALGMERKIAVDFHFLIFNYSNCNCWRRGWGCDGESIEVKCLYTVWVIHPSIAYKYYGVYHFHFP